MQNQNDYNKIYNKLKNYGLFRLDTIDTPSRYTDGMNLDEVIVGDFNDETVDVAGLEITNFSDRNGDNLIYIQPQELSINVGNIKPSDEELKKIGETVRGYLIKSLRLVKGELDKANLRNVQTQSKTRDIEGITENDGAVKDKNTGENLNIGDVVKVDGFEGTYQVAVNMSIGRPYLTPFDMGNKKGNFPLMYLAMQWHTKA